MTRKQSTLTPQQAIQLRDFLAAERAYLNEAMLGYPAAAEYASAKLGWAVTLSNVRSVATSAGLTWQRPRARSATPRPRSGKRQFIERTVVLNEVRRALVGLLHELGAAVPAALCLPFRAGDTTYTLAGSEASVPAGSTNTQLTLAPGGQTT